MSSEHEKEADTGARDAAETKPADDARESEPAEETEPAAERATRLPKNDLPTLNIPVAELPGRTGPVGTGRGRAGADGPDTGSDTGPVAAALAASGFGTDDGDEESIPQHLATTQIPTADPARMGRLAPPPGFGEPTGRPDYTPGPGYSDPAYPAPSYSDSGRPGSGFGAPEFTPPAPPWHHPDPGAPQSGPQQPGFGYGPQGAPYPPQGPGPGQPPGGRPDFGPGPGDPGQAFGVPAFGQPGAGPQPGFGPQGPAPSGYPGAAQGYTYAGPGPQPGYDQPQLPPPTIDEIDAAREQRRAPQKGWRGLLHKISGGRVTPADSADEIELRALTQRVRHPVNGDYKIAVLSLKGGVGKTTTTVGLGATFASLRGDRVIAVDANPDFGTLAQRGPQQTRATVRDLLHDADIHRYSDVRAYTSQAPSRLELIASERDPAVSVAFSDDDYRGVIGTLQRFYNIILTDCGTGLMHSAMSAVLNEADAIVLVSSAAIDGARSASATLDWLEHHGYGELVKRSVVVLSNSRPGPAGVDLEQLTRHFLARTRAVHTLPFDPHLAEGAELDLELLTKPTRRALVELAAVVADDFGRPRPIRDQPDREPADTDRAGADRTDTERKNGERADADSERTGTGADESADHPRHGTRD